MGCSIPRICHGTVLQLDSSLFGETSCFTPRYETGLQLMCIPLYHIY